ncbi:MAG: hypothetical protein NC124_02105 [Clostridium sp.]|nr:hypothetical protein [Clostridium sp.]
MKVSHERAFALFGDIPELSKIKGKVYISLMDENSYKTNSQNRLFHGLLDVFWRSGCSSFESYEDMRVHYKQIAGLVEISYQNDLLPFTKKCLFKAIKLLPISISEYNKIILYLKGQKMKELSWSKATKENAVSAIDALIYDMNESGVVVSKCGKEYERILKTLGMYI